MRRTFLPLLAPAFVSLALGACGGGAAVATLEVEPQTVRLPHPRLETIRLTWRPLTGLEAERPLVFVHLIDGAGKILRTFDHPLPGRWREGVPIADDIDLYQSALGPPLAAGSYRLTVGLYELGGERWPLEVAGEEVAKREYAVATVEVPESQEGPQFAFSSAWLPTEAGGDVQILARRWLTGEGSIRVTGAPSPGKVWLVLRIPSGEDPGTRLVLDGGSNTPGVVVGGTCGGVETGISGPGTHEVEMPVEAAGGQGCEIRLRPNFRLEVQGAAESRSVVLENLAFTPEP